MGELSHSEMPNQPNELGGTCRNQEVAHYSCSFHLNGQTVGFCPQTQKLGPPCKV